MSSSDLPWDLDGWGEISFFLGTSERTAQRYADSSHDPMPVMKFGGRVKARRSDLVGWLNRKTTPGTSRVVS